MHHIKEQTLGPNVGLLIDYLHLLVSMPDGIGRSWCTSRSRSVLLFMDCISFAIQQPNLTANVIGW
jgi:hypothetical protein